MILVEVSRILSVSLFFVFQLCSKLITIDPRPVGCYLAYFSSKVKPFMNETTSSLLCCHYIVFSANLHALIPCIYSTGMENLNDLGDYLNTEIVCTLAGLGYSEGSDYYKSPDCVGKLDGAIML